MADILIKGMEMPENCSLCKLAQYRVFACTIMCPITRQIVGYYDEGFHQEEHACPLVLLLEGHGRLIDADALKKEIDANRPGRIYEDGWTLTVVDHAPTIVPAEGGTENG